MQKDIRPYLIQRGKFENVTKDEIVGIDSLIRFDYMGSAEFEFGALPKSLKRMTSRLDAYELLSVQAMVDVNNSPVYVYCQEEMFPSIVKILPALAERSVRLKEFSGFDAHFKGGDDDEYWRRRVNFWWDIDHDFMFFFGKENAKNIQLAVERLRDRWKTEGKI